MSDHPLDSFRAEDAHHGGERTVSFDGEVLTVRFYRVGRDDLSSASAQHHYRLTEVQPQWVEVEQ